MRKIIVFMTGMLLNVMITVFLLIMATRYMDDFWSYYFIGIISTLLGNYLY